MKSFIPAILATTLIIGCTGKPSSQGTSNAQSKIQTTATPNAQTKIKTTETTKTEFVSAKLAPFKNAANGKLGQEVLATWKNVGDTPVRIVDASIKSREPNGNMIDSFNYVIYAEFDDAPGVLPGETYTTKAGNGFKLPGFEGLPGYTPADSVEVTITKSSKTSGM